MKIEWVQVPRRPNWPWWAIVLPMLWLTLGGIVLWLAARAGRTLVLCLFKRATGYPCPTCGFTRGSLSFLHGHPVQAWLYNPLLFTFLGAFAMVVFIRVISGRHPQVSLTRAERLAAWIISVALFAANWLYVIRYVG
jgi:hypothetical protein